MPANGDRKIKVLVTDDDNAVQALLKEFLTREGYEVLQAGSGMECIEIAKEQTPDLILLDVIMPEMGGGMAAHRLSENILTRNIPIIFLTSMISKEQEMVVDNEDGSYLFLSKPIEVDKLLKEMDKALSGNTSDA